ncbi:MAG: hypothetical protein PHD21_05830, partial [Flavobacteriales bacterium]|nr:hypothetical protein [Flavobacteriales bacterium]
FPVVGVSMEPEIHSGDVIGISPIQDYFGQWEYLNTTRIYLIITPYERMVKYITDPTHPDYIVCSSPNAAPFRVPKTDIIQLFTVRAIARRL